MELIVTRGLGKEQIWIMRMIVIFEQICLSLFPVFPHPHPSHTRGPNRTKSFSKDTFLRRKFTGMGEYVLIFFLNLNFSLLENLLELSKYNRIGLLKHEIGVLNFVLFTTIRKLIKRG